MAATETTSGSARITSGGARFTNDQGVPVCNKCGSDGLLDAQDFYCAICTADQEGWQSGRRMQALLAVAIAVDAARDSDQCSPEQVRGIVADTLAGGGYSEETATELAEAAA